MPAHVYGHGIEGSLSCVATYETSGYPAWNIVNRDKDVITAAYEPEAQWILTLKLEEARLADTLVIVNCNAYDSWDTSGTRGIKLYTHDLDDGTFHPPGDAGNEYWVASATSYIAPGVGDQPHWLRSFQQTMTQPRQWWRLIAYQSCIRELFTLGHLLITFDLASGVSYDRPRALARKHRYDLSESWGGKQQSSYRWGPKQRKHLKWSQAEQDFIDDVVEFWDTIYGGHLPFLFEDLDGSYEWVRAMAKGNLPYSEDKHKLWTVAFPIETEL